LRVRKTADFFFLSETFPSNFLTCTQLSSVSNINSQRPQAWAWLESGWRFKGSILCSSICLPSISFHIASISGSGVGRWGDRQKGGELCGFAADQLRVSLFFPRTFSLSSSLFVWEALRDNIAHSSATSVVRWSLAVHALRKGRTEKGLGGGNKKKKSQDDWWGGPTNHEVSKISLNFLK
jgi:hypothetical protein